MNKAQIIDGKQIAAKLCEAIKDNISATKTSPTLAIMRVGDDPAGDVYVRNKMNKAGELGINCLYAHYSAQDHLSAWGTMSRWANDASVHGIILQLPAPGCEGLAEAYIPLEKDVDGFLPGSPFSPCTPKGIMTMLHAVHDEIGTDLAGKHAVVVGRSEIVGRPIAKMLLDEDCTVTVCHSKTSDLGEFTKEADILVVATGKPGLITGEMVREGAIVIDVGMNRVDGKLVGDVDFESVSQVAVWITPVPGGVGPMTVASLMENVWLAWRMQQGK